MSRAKSIGDVTPGVLSFTSSEPASARVEDSASTAPPHTTAARKETTGHDRLFVRQLFIALCGQITSPWLLFIYRRTVYQILQHSSSNNEVNALCCEVQCALTRLDKGPFCCTGP